MHACAFSFLREEGNQPKVLGEAPSQETGGQEAAKRWVCLYHRDFCRLWLRCLSTSGENTELKLRLFSPFYWHVQQEQSRSLHFPSASSQGLSGGMDRRNGLQSQLQEGDVGITPTGHLVYWSLTSCFSASTGCRQLYFRHRGAD